MLDKKSNPSRAKEIIRASISFNSEDYEQLERLAIEKKVSLAWVVREAVSLYIQDDAQDDQIV
jgi:hypothetical protein